MNTDKEAKEQIIQITNELFSMGLLTATGGNISALADGETMWITPSQMYKGDLHEEDLVHIKFDGTVLEGTRQPSVEYQMHGQAYQVRPGTTGAVHTHAPIATAFGICTAEGFMNSTSEVSISSACVPCGCCRTAASASLPAARMFV